MYTCRYPDLYKLHQMIRNCRANYCWTKITGWNEINHSQQDIIPVPTSISQVLFGILYQGCSLAMSCFPSQKGFTDCFTCFSMTRMALASSPYFFCWVAQETVEWRNIRDERDVSHSCARIQSIGHGQNLSAADAPLEIP